MKTFEDLQIWQKSRILVKEVYVISSKGDLGRDFGLRDQMRRCAVSVVSNISEGYERAGDAEFHRFVSIAKGSVGELRAQVYVCLDLEYITEDEFQSLIKKCTEISKMAGALMKKLKGL